ncbi:cobyrinate a,c-diamide synthase [Corynebacterium epidermidicanis]|uniref:Hydrogenobyrinate a,c-diamide synthase n=1 Tax=Corynebacterium epidermidicanis TaxID=1050174 RepID=A0A0G3GS40_9CORY|nr:cobyrinate a,c-diamide synthase [Corynebacterium epidermidicanis]AKK03385.1 cobyrinic acid a,c-diamide synthase [Corynebacterium epidermidicanis]
MVTPGILIAATGSGTGKTTIATGLMAAFARSRTVAPFKVGPDYIDPSYHALATGMPGRNLDAVMCPGLIGPLYAHGSAGADIAIVEGVMGLFDGRIGGQPTGSSADIAAELRLPVLLIVDVRGMSQSVGALVRGFVLERPDIAIRGVILNQVGSERHSAVCREAVEAIGVPVVGAIPRVEKVSVPSRHLGLVTAEEHGGAARDAVERMADLVTEYCDLSLIAELASCGYDGPAWQPLVSHGPHVRVAFAGGPAFTFAYAEHRELLEACGAEVIYFDPLVDDFPECDGLIIPGGFPEEHVEKLSGRVDLRDAVRAHVAAGKPVHAECAGLLWLVETLDAHPMLGLIPTHAAMRRRLTLGYREAVSLTDSVLYRAGERVMGHEFHHTALALEEVSGWDEAWAWRAWDGSAVTEGFVGGSVHASYLHVHPAAVPGAVARFVEACARAH